MAPGIPQIEPYTLPTVSDLPANTASWTPDPDRAVLLVHDMQRFFLKPLPESLRSGLIGNTAALRDRAARLGVPVGYTAQPGGMSEEQRGLLKDFWGPGMRRTPEDRQVVDELAPVPGDWVLDKWRYSAFHRSELLELIRRSGRDQLIICGVYAHVGVLMTANDAFAHDLQTFLVADAVADFTEEEHLMALRYAARRCAVVLDTAEVLV
ncbi:isochorismatase family protein [Nocardiopsis sp. CNT312]|uniref:isochorismatase family protein n=1 Tax=Nocardiopsis sp. CNT312 TaxID=1137268 RepID=UPI00048B17B5|nr:isochorismatase family protein [Nocardiopsis sp. CNT312]